VFSVIASVGAATAIGAVVSTFIGNDAPAWFMSRDKSGKAYRGGDNGNGNFSRGKRSARLRKEGNFNDWDNAYFYRNGGGDIVLRAHPSAKFQGLTQHGVDITVAKNSWVVRFRFSDGTESYAQCLFLDSRQVFFNWHTYAAFASSDLIDVAFFPDHPSTGVQTALVLGSETMYSISRPSQDRDLGRMLLTKAYMPGMRDLWKLVPSDSDLKESVLNVFRNVQGVVNGKSLAISEGPFKCLLMRNSTRKIVLNTGNTEYEDSLLTYYVAYGAKGEAGDCGFPYLSIGGSSYPLVGIHGARCGDDAFVVPILDTDNVFAEKKATAQSFVPGLEERLSPLDKPVNQIKGTKPIATYTGQEFCSPPMSKFILLSPELKDALPPDEIKYKPILTQRAQKNRLESTFNFGESPQAPSYIKDPAWSNGFCPFDVTFEGFLTFEQALFGDPDLELDSMASSSKFVGHFFAEAKKDLVNFADKTYHPKLKERVMEYISMARTEPVHPVCAQFAKDELLAKDKVEDEICRLINGHDFAYNIFLRMLTGRYLNQLIKHPALVPAAIGINPISHEWEMVHTAAIKFGPVNCIAGDLSKQEATTNMEMRDDFITHVSSYYIHTDEEDLIFRNGLAGLNGYYFVRDSTLYLSMKGHSSGHLLTTTYNSYVTWWLHKRAFEVVYPENDFTKAVSIKVLGDDSVGSVHPSFTDYSMLTVQEYAKSLGMKYTMADKHAEVIKFYNANELTFLGRKFAKLNWCRTKFTVGCLRKEAIHDLLVYTVDVPGMERSQVSAIRFDQAFREAVLWGPDYYNNLSQAARQAYLQRGLYCPKIPRWKDLGKQIFGNWYKTDYSQRADTAPCKKALNY
jgi:hypothetical protein